VDAAKKVVNSVNADPRAVSSIGRPESSNVEPHPVHASSVSNEIKYKDSRDSQPFDGMDENIFKEMSKWDMVKTKKTEVSHDVFYISDIHQAIRFHTIV
jgi:hypothetical protein